MKESFKKKFARSRLKWSCGKNRKLEISEEVTCPESGAKKEASKTENVMGGLC